MSGDEEVRRVSRQDIQLVQNLIERCLQLYMTRKEVVETLLVQAKIEPDFTELVWQKLEEENKEFFKAYHMRLLVKNQIVVFNKLLEKQADFMSQMSPSGITPVSMPNGSQTSSLHQTPSCYNKEHTLTHARPNNIAQHPVGPSSPLRNGAGPSNPLHNGLLTHGSLKADDSQGQNERRDASPNLPPTQNSHLVIKQETNGVGDLLGRGYSNSSFTFGGGVNNLEMRPPNGDSSSAVPFGNLESNNDTLNEKLPDNDPASFGFLGQIPRNFSLSDLTADFSHSFDILESYPRSPFVPSANDNLLDLTGRDYEGEQKRLNGVSEDFNYDDFSSD
ncbi:histidine-tRNA ligase [Thalictrum thalictroides]|uniref:Histidine-tRNA ligase n=1 Tax=Thalictrum thalictroides TaxID=46969 RepID=A0A7J6VB37_THATH|nr:histidine-tRNA ligase [Thalictrum thalictroides]